MRRPSLLRATTSDSEGPSQRQIWLFRLAKFLLVLTFVEDGLRIFLRWGEQIHYMTQVG